MVAVASSALAAMERVRSHPACREVRLDLVELDEASARCLSAPGPAATVLWRRGMSGAWLAQALAALPDLQWAHSDRAGVDSLPLALLSSRGVVLTNAAGVYSRPMAEWVMLAMLAAVKRFREYAGRSDAGKWDQGALLGELTGKQVLMLGYGSVGRLAAEMAVPFGLEVVASVRKSRREAHPGVSRLVTGEAWRDELPSADYVIVTLPLTAETRGLLDARAFAAMKPGSWLVNVARGGLIDERALCAALEEGRLGGAVLDAFEPEPLPPSSSLWGRGNVLVLPHVTWSSTMIEARIETLFAEQLARFATSEPLVNVVDLAAGY